MTTLLRCTDPRANPNVLSWQPVVANALDAITRGIACTTLPVERNPAAGALLTSGVVLAGNQLDVASTTTVAGDLSVHGHMSVAAPLRVDGVLAVLGALRTAANAAAASPPAVGGLLVVGANASLTVRLASAPAAGGLPPADVVVAQYAGVVGRFAAVTVESPDGSCQYALDATTALTYGGTSLSLSVNALSGCGGGGGGPAGLSQGAIIGCVLSVRRVFLFLLLMRPSRRIAVGAALAGVAAAIVLALLMARHRALTTQRFQAELRAKATDDLRHDNTPYVPAHAINDNLRELGRAKAVIQPSVSCHLPYGVFLAAGGCSRVHHQSTMAPHARPMPPWHCPLAFAERVQHRHRQRVMHAPPPIVHALAPM